ncbi:alpha-ketoglutarate-dependent dioxygenase AlkB family protein [Isoalcanivorax indicus]|uniref:alpha-ketoglutarate-dependent dioxygenase AlkB family protein n=1 Tax=Isoalcanivorax indicus TaxID=2202653 RepID=UPI000DB9DCBA|nr:alpha-ketoglutarate-dependent dioxygenase AlkB [Isoalcanivorax indicus]
MTGDLFSANASASASANAPLLRPLPGTPGLQVWPAVLGASRANVLMDRLLASLPWSQPEVTVYGRTGPVPRLQSWHGDPDADYAYSGLPLPPRPWTPELDALRRTVEAVTGHRYNSVLANLYRNGEDTMGWHADDERELGPQPWIASYSLGATRDFTLRRKGQGRIEDRIALAHDQLILMPPAMQRLWEHALPRRARVSAPRLNLTFRLIRKTGR